MAANRFIKGKCNQKDQLAYFLQIFFRFRRSFEFFDGESITNPNIQWYNHAAITRIYFMGQIFKSCSTQRWYIFPEGCNPSSAIKDFSFNASREMGVMSR